ncbi:PspC domain-containing protein [Kitasatospora sp. NPDC059722]|uniref:PspC domain-containing protein n=1 Tax=Kitasatospora sp. NPDC059722 TaxID=3346925 RepID=UPI00368D674A
MTEDHRIQDAGPAAPPEPDRPPLTRAEHHRVVAGVCGGLGRHLDIDPVVFRVVTVVLCLSGGLGLFLYGLAWLVVPTEGSPDGRGAGRGGRTELQRVLTGRVDGQSVGAVLLTVIGTGVFFSSMGDGDQMLPLLLLAGLVFLAVRYDPERRKARARGRRRGGPYDRYFPEAEAPGSPYVWPRQDVPQDESARARHAAMGVPPAEGWGSAAGTVPADTPAPGPTGYLWDPRHPERNPYGATATPPRSGAPKTGATPPYGTPVPPPGTPSQPWWQRTDLPEGDPLRKAGPAAPPKPTVVRHPKERSALGFFGFLLAIGAGAAVWSATVGHNSITVVSSTVLATALLVVGLTLLVGAKFGRARKLAAIGLLLTLGLAFVGRSPNSLQNAFGDRTWTVASASQLKEKYGLGAGQARLDLSALDPAGAELSSRVEMGAGDLTVVVPSDVTVNVVTQMALGSISVPGSDGNDSTGRHTYEIHPGTDRPSKGTLDLMLEVGLGNIKVVQK